MNIKLHTTLACSTLILLMMCGTGYGITTHDDHSESPGTVVVVDNRLLEAIPEKPAAEKTLPNADARGKTTSTVTTVSKWLEARANDHYASELHTGDCSHEDAESIQDDGMVMGGGWCDLCGCWMRHGCDPNGNCTIGHEQVCGSGNCSLHPYNSCRNSG